MSNKRFSAAIKRADEARLANYRVPASCIIDQLPGTQVAPASNGSPGVVDLDNVEPALGNPASNGYVLSSTTAGVRSWIGTLDDARLSSNVPLLNVANQFSVGQGIGAAALSYAALYAYRAPASPATLEAGAIIEVDTTNSSDTAAQTGSLFAINRYRGSASSSEAKGQSGIVLSVFNTNTGTTARVQGGRLDVRNLAAGIVTRMAGFLINAIVNSGGGTIATAAGLYLEQQTAGGANWQIYSDGGNSRLGAGFVEISEMSAPAAGAANTARLYVEDNGAGKTRLMVKFNTGAAVQIAIQP
jgi:hypothetical protein